MIRQILISFFVLLALHIKADSSLAMKDAAQQWEQLMADSAQVMRDNVSESVRLCDEAQNVARQFGPTDTRLSQSQILRARIYLWEKKNDLAEQTFKLAITSCEKAVGSNNVVLVYPLSSLANFYSSDVSRNDLALPLFQRILNIVENTPDRNNRDVIMWSRDLGMIYQQMGRYAEAEPMFKQAVAVAGQNYAEWLPYELLTASDFYRTWGKYEQAEILAKRALTIREKALKPDGGVDAQMDVTVCLNNLGETYLAWSKPDQAEAVYNRSLAIVQKFMAEDQPDLMPYLEGLAAALRAQGKLDQAEPLFKRLLMITEKSTGAESLDTALLLEKYAALLNEMKKPSEAKALLDRAARIRVQNTAKEQGEAAESTPR
jgi:tetratricopeptide (TPR) repeat protein